MKAHNHQTPAASSPLQWFNRASLVVSGAVALAAVGLVALCGPAFLGSKHLGQPGSVNSAASCAWLPVSIVPQNLTVVGRRVSDALAVQSQQGKEQTPCKNDPLP
jgi:hypothetical protein